MRRRLRKQILRGALAGVLAFEVLLQLFLNSPFLPSWVSRGDRLVVDWDFAWSVWPTRVHVSGFRLHRREGFGRWSLELGRAVADVDLGALRDRRFETRRLEAHGVAFHLDPGPTPPPRPHKPGPPGPDRSWGFAIRGVELHDLDHFSAGWFHLTAQLEGGGSLEITKARTVTISGVRLHVSDGLATGGSGTPGHVDDLVIVADGEAHKVKGQSTGKRLLQGLSGTIDVNAHWDELTWLGAFAASDAGLLRRGAGQLRGSLRVKDGALEEGSHLAAWGESVWLRAGPLAFTGPYDWRVTVPDGPGPTRLDATVAPVSVSAVDSDRADPLVAAKSLRVALQAGGREVLDLFGRFEVNLGFRGATLPGLRRSSASTDRPLEVTSGTFSLDVALTVPLDPGAWVHCELVGRALEARWGATRFSGAVTANGRLRRLRPGWYGGDATASVSDVRLHAKGQSAEPFSAHVSLTGVRADRRGQALSGRLDGHLSDATPLLALVTESAGLPSVLGVLLDVRAVRLGTDATLARGRLTLRHLDVGAEHVRVRGRVATEGGESRAVLRVDLLAFTLGVEVTPAGTRTRIWRVHDWLREQAEPG